MLVSLSWLNDYVDISDIDVKEFKEKMIMTGTNAESTDARCDEIKKVVMAKITEIHPHPDATSLVICVVDNGEEVTEVVTGATNMVEGDYVLMAKHKSKLPGGVSIKRSKLRGVKSNGMFLSYSELGYEDSVVPKGYEDGLITYKEPFCELGESPMPEFLLDNYILEFEITPNRPDCLSMLGIAREAKATFGRELKEVKTFDFETVTEESVKTVSSADTDACSRFIGLEIDDVVVTESPQCIKSRLMASGVRPINSIVDIGNLVMLETGQPLHCYDYDKLNGNLTASRLEKDEKVLCLDDEERTVSKGAIVISDEEKIVAIAGIMGASNSAVSEDTKKIFLEAANFNASIIREHSKKLNLRSESSSRNEKGINAPLALDAVKRFAYLVEKYGFGKVNKKYFDFYENEFVEPVIEIDENKINALLGTTISRDEITSIFGVLGFKVEDGEKLKVTIPYYRTDVLKDYDLIEEVARIYGYQNIPMTMPKLDIGGGLNRKQSLRNKAGDIIIGLDYSEVVTYSFIGNTHFDKLNVPEDSSLRENSRIKNPLGEEFSIMRPLLLSSLLEIVEYNVKRNNSDLKFFEISSVFDSQNVNENNAPVQGENLCIVAEGVYADFFKLKSDFDLFVRKLGVKGISYVKNATLDSFHPGRTADILLDGKVIGMIGEVHPTVLKNYGINSRVSAVELDFNKLISSISHDFKYEKLPKFPAATRDIAIVVDSEMTNGELKDVIMTAGGSLLESVKLFDVYEGKHIEAGKKSLAYSLIFRDREKTLEEADIVKAYDDIIKALEVEKGAVLRK